MKSAKKNLSENELKAKSAMKSYTHTHTHIYGDTQTLKHINICELLKQSKCVTVAEREAEQRNREEVSRGRGWRERKGGGKTDRGRRINGTRSLHIAFAAFACHRSRE